MSRFNVLILLVSLLSLSVMAAASTTANYTYTYKMSESMAKAIDIGMAEMVKSTKWQQLFLNLGLSFPIPSCNSKYGTTYPTNPFYSNQVIKICYEMPGPVWYDLYKGAGDMLVSLLNEKYGTSMTTKHIILNTTSMGYFDTMANAVNTGICDVCTSAVIYTQARSSLVNFNCPYGSSSLSMLRSTLNNTINGTVLFPTVESLNNSKAIVVVYGGSYYETWARQNIPAAKLIYAPGGYDECYEYIKQGSVHATIGDAVDFSGWLNTNKQNNCTSCFVKLIGAAFTYSSVTTLNTSHAILSAVCSYQLLMLIFMVLYLVTL